jgi:hypothetical protein
MEAFYPAEMLDEDEDDEGEIAHCGTCGMDYYTFASHECRRCGLCLPWCKCPVDGSDG